jgi:DNA-binding YbaB/EbfC family protein
MLKRILVVVSERHIARLIEVNLYRAGYEVVLAVDGKEALQVIEWGPPALVIMDVMLPATDGYALLKRLRENPETRSLPVFMFAPQIQETDMFRGWADANAWPTEPLHLGNLLAFLTRFFKADEADKEGEKKMARFGGLPGGLGGFGDMQKLMKQAQKMQEDATQLQEDLVNARIEANAGGGMVSATVNGHGHLVEIKINPVVVDPEDVEMLEDLIITAVKEATAKAEADQKARMESITGGLEGLNLPPGLLG